MDKEIVFCRKYLSQICGIKPETINVLIENDYDSIHTLLALDLNLDLERLPNVSMGQKSLLRKAFTKMRNEYNSIENKLMDGSIIHSEQIDLTFYKNGFTDTLMRQMIQNEVNSSNKILQSSQTQCSPQQKPNISESIDNQKRFKLSQVKTNTFNKKRINRLSHDNSLDNDLEPNVCQICGDIKNIKNQSGVKICDACNAFFRKFSHQTVPKCVADGNCLINKETRKDCKFCRLQKCLNLGMNGRQSVKFKPNKRPKRKWTKNKNNKKCVVAKHKSNNQFKTMDINDDNDDDDISRDQIQTNSNDSYKGSKETVVESEVTVHKLMTTSGKLKSCKICGAQSSRANEVQFGVESCGGCGTFFRRVFTKAIKINGCVADGNCLINQETRNKCKFCRFQKCIEVGMNGQMIGVKHKNKTLNSSIVVGDSEQEEAVRHTKMGANNELVSNTGEPEESILQSYSPVSETVANNCTTASGGRNFESSSGVKRKRN